MRYRVLDLMEIDYSILDKQTVEDKKVIGMIFDIAKTQYLYIEKIQFKCNNFIIYIVKDTNNRVLIHDLRGDCLRFSNSKNIDRWIDINDFLESKFSF